MQTTNNSKKKRFFIIFGLQIILLFAIGFYFLTDFNTLNFFNNEANKKYFIQESSCDLHHSECTIKLDKQQVITLSITPKHIPLMKPLTFKVTTQNVNATTLQLKIYATNMNMGIHKFTLKKVALNHYEAIGTLPTCIVGDMIWNAEISSSDFANEGVARFTFQTDI